MNKSIVPAQNGVITNFSTNPLDKSLQSPATRAAIIPEQTLPTIASKAMFWRPRYLAESEWLQHVPFYFWLTEVLQPKVVVKPDINSAVGYFAICQAMDKLNQDGLVYGAFGADCDAERISTYNHEHYREFSSISNQTEKNLINELSENSIDLLLIQSSSSLLDNEINIENLRRHMSNKGVVIIHGTTSETVRKKCQALKSRYPTFELTQVPGLLLLCLGQHIPARLEMMIHQSKEPSSQRLIQNIYARLGAASEDSWHRLAQQQQLQQLRETIQAATNNQVEFTLKLQQQQQDASSTIAALTAERDNLRATNIQLMEKSAESIKGEQALRQDLQTRFDELAALTQLLVNAEAANEKVTHTVKTIIAERDKLQTANSELKTGQQNLEQQLLSLKNELVRTKEQCAMLERDQAVAAERIATLTHSELALKQALADRFDELATLTNQLVEAEQAFHGNQQEIRTPTPQIHQAHSRVGVRLKATLNAVKPHKGRAKLAKKVTLIRESHLFNEAWYLQQYPEAVSHSYGAVGHYLEIGAAKGANPSPQFDGNAYLQANQDVKQAGMNPLYHYINFGRAEGRNF